MAGVLREGGGESGKEVLGFGEERAEEVHWFGKICLDDIIE